MLLKREVTINRDKRVELTGSPCEQVPVADTGPSKPRDSVHLVAA